MVCETVDMTDSTEKLIKLIKDPTKILILTTIQKMANACKNDINTSTIRSGVYFLHTVLFFSTLLLTVPRNVSIIYLNN